MAPQRFVPILSASSDQLLRTVASALPGGSVNVFDRDYRYIFVAGSGLEGASLAPEGLLGRTLRDVFGEDAGLVEPFYERAFAGESVSFDLPVFGRIYAMTAAPLIAASPSVVVLAQDVTMVRNEIRAHEVAEATLAALNREQDVFLATMLHELRQPLAPLRFGLEILKRPSGGPAPQRALAAMERQIQQLERLLIDLTDLAGGVSDRLGLRPEPVDITPLLADVLDDAETLMRPKGHDLRRDLPLDSAHVHGDAARLRQVFSNLLMNAAKYTETGGRISVSARLESEQVRVAVRDNGRGIDPAALPKIFDLFVQGDPTVPGMGVGLHVVRQIVERHGGQVQAHSAGEGHGSEFVVTLPLIGR